jgi:hypothetical protein
MISIMDNVKMVEAQGLGKLSSENGFIFLDKCSDD